MNSWDFYSTVFHQSGHKVWAPKLVYWCWKPSRYANGIKFLNYGRCFWDTFRECSPPNSKLTIKLEEVCNERVQRVFITNNHIKPTTSNKLKCYINLEEFQSFLACTKENFCWEKQYASFYLQQNHTRSLENKTIINTPLFIRGHILLVFSVLFSSFLFYSLVNMISFYHLIWIH